MGEKFKSCAQEVEQACQGDIDQADKDKGKEAKQACEEGAKASEAVAADKAGSGMDMSKMGEMAGKAAEMLQQMMKKKEEGAKDAAAVADQAASGIAAPAEATIAATKSEGASQFAQSATFDGLEAARATTDGGGGAAAAAGNGAQAQSYTHGSEGSDTGTNGSDPRGGAGISSGGGSYSPTAGGGGGGSSSGASSYDPNAEAAKAAAGGADPASGAYEISSGGGGGSKFLGLKSKSSELSDLDGALGGEGGAGLNLAALGAEGEGRDPASEGSTQNADIHADGSSLFNVVRSKLVEIKKRGNI
ncbi:MAG: hypothetical protein EOP11_11855 [Proteobacteria bacterium]|nr:MAG: hypothetical protein EOP11_11855 [Pseudomonadota bacterium]